MRRLTFLLLSFFTLALASAPASANPADAAKPLKILFVCEHGYGKSMVASKFMEREALRQSRRVVIESRGIAPETPVPAGLVANMARDKFDVTRFTPRKLTEADLREADRVIVFNMDLPAPEGVTVERWDVPALSERYDVARDAIVARLKTLLLRRPPPAK